MCTIFLIVNEFKEPPSIVSLKLLTMSFKYYYSIGYGFNTVSIHFVQIKIET